MILCAEIFILFELYFACKYTVVKDLNEKVNKNQSDLLSAEQKFIILFTFIYMLWTCLACFVTGWSEVGIGLMALSLFKPKNLNFIDCIASIVILQLGINWNLSENWIMAIK